MKRQLYTLIILISMLFGAPNAKADLFGGDVVVLTQILVQAIQQLAQLKSILESTNGQLDLTHEINRGINDSLNLIRTIDPNINPGIYKDWESTTDSFNKLQSIYGGVVESPEARVQRDLDQGIAEAVAFNNNYYKYTQQLDELGEQIKSASHETSPGGAAKLTAQSLGLVIQVLNQNLRVQATGLKLHAQELAVQNKKEKEQTKHFLDSTASLKAAMQNEKVVFEIPRF